MTRRSTRSSTSRRVNQEKPRLYQAETLNKADEEMNELMIITVSTRTEKHCNSSVDTSKRVSRALYTFRFRIYCETVSTYRRALVASRRCDLISATAPRAHDVGSRAVPRPFVSPHGRITTPLKSEPSGCHFQCDFKVKNRKATKMRQRCSRAMSSGRR